MQQTDPERIAWRVLLISFTIFLLIAGVTIYAGQWFLFQSTRPMILDLDAARGTVIVTLPNTEETIAVAEHRNDIEIETIIQTDSTSQAILTFSDPNTGEPVASMVLFKNSQIKLTLAEAPRFGLNRKPYLIQISSEAGDSEILLFNHDSRLVKFEVVSPQAFIRMEETGQYTLNIAETDTSVAALSGQALIIDSDTGHNIILSKGEQTSVTPDEALEITEAKHSIIVNGRFEDLYETSWNFYNDREPPGTTQNVLLDGRPAVMINRSQSNWPGEVLGHGETGLVQFLEIDVSDYSFLEIRATFYIEEQSLATCGIVGSECPLMIHMKYLDPEDQEQLFIHGFFDTFNLGLDYPTTCISCRVDHEQINGESWYTYQSGNLITQFPTQRPVFITELSFYASGHAFVVYISDIEIFVSE